MDWIGLIIQLVSGVVGGNVAGALMKNANLSMAVKTIAGAIGGVGGGQILAALMGGGAAAVDGAAPGLDVTGLVSSIAGGGIGGAVLAAIAGMVMKGDKA